MELQQDIMTFEAEKVKLSSGLFKDFVVCTAYLMSDGVNRNKSEFTLESLEKSIPTFENKPVLANIWFQKGSNGYKKAYVGSHDYKVEKDENGDEYISYKDGERPVGVITNKSQINIQKYKGRNFVVAKLFLWKQYNPELIKILARDKRKKVSVEVVFKKWEDYEDENGQKIRKVLDFDFLGVTILGHQKKIFGEPELVEEGIENSHLELDEGQLESYVASYSSALDSEIRDNRAQYDSIMKSNEVNSSLSIESKRQIVLKELNDMYSYSRGGGICLFSFYSPENSLGFSGKMSRMYVENPNKVDTTSVREEGWTYKPEIYVEGIRGNINFDGSCDILEKIEFTGEEKNKIISAQMKYLDSLKTNRDLIINEVNLVADEENSDVNQLIYTLFTYQNSDDIVNLLFGIVEDGWKTNPYEKLGLPIASVNQHAIIFNERALREDMGLQSLQKLYQKIEFMTGFNRVRDIVKSIIEEKYEMGETSNVEKENEAVNQLNTEELTNENELNKDNVNENAENKIDENDCGQDNLCNNDCGGEEPKPDENACGGEEPNVNADEEGGEEPKSDNDCGGEDGQPAENANEEEPKDNKPEENAADDNKDGEDGEDDGEDDKDEDGNKEDESANEELAQKYEVALSQIAKYSEEINALKNTVETSAAENEKLNKELEEAKTEINSLKLSAFLKEVDAELAASALDDKNKEKIYNSAKEQKFENITDVQKEIAFVEKTTRTDSYTFVSNIVNTSKSEPEGVFDKLKAKIKW